MNSLSILAALLSGWFVSPSLPISLASSQPLATQPGAPACSSFTFADSTLASLTATHHYASGKLVNLTSSSGTVDTTSLPAFCRLIFDVHTNPATDSHAVTEIWLPDQWSYRLVGLGNSGWSGGINFGDLAYVGVNHSYAAFSTNGGHNSSSFSGSWGSDPEALIDFGGRAMHLSTVLAKEVVTQYYSSPPVGSYYLGCSTGGREGLKAVQEYPTDFDGVAVGSPANWLSHLHSWGVHIQNNVLPVDSPQWIPEKLWPVIHAEVLAQCDAIDGLKDGIVNDPRRCSFRPELLTCRPNESPCDPHGTSACTCLTLPQIAALNRIYADYYETNQTYIFGGYVPGGELGYYGGLLGPKPFETAIDYFKYMVLNDTTWNSTTLNYSTIELADFINPGGMNANNPNITSFVGSGNAKVIQYVGWADQYISPLNSLYYYATVQSFMAANTELDINDYYRLFPVPGMMHCHSGAGANAFGGAQQASEHMPAANDTSHDILLALIQWVEGGNENAPDQLIATKYVNDSAALGVAFTRPICKFPLEVTWDGTGDVNASTSFTCQ